MRRALCAIFLTTLAASTSQAGYVGEVNLSTGSYSDGSLGNSSGGQLVGTNLLATTATSAGGTVTNIGGYFDFTTGAQTANDGNGNITYAAGGTFYVLSGLLAPPGQPNPPSYSSCFMSTGVATQTETGQQVEEGTLNYNVYMLTMNFSTTYLSPTLTNAFDSPSDSLSNRIYFGTLTFTFINDDSIGGNQLLSGSISYSVPEPSSYAMVLIGGLGVLGYGRRRLRGHQN
jgi:hypothetical protein